MVDQLAGEEAGPDVTITLDRDATDWITNRYEIERGQKVPMEGGILRVDRCPGSWGEHEPVLDKADCPHRRRQSCQRVHVRIVEPQSPVEYHAPLADRKGLLIGHVPLRVGIAPGVGGNRRFHLHHPAGIEPAV